MVLSVLESVDEFGGWVWDGNSANSALSQLDPEFLSPQYAGSEEASFKFCTFVKTRESWAEKANSRQTAMNNGIVKDKGVITKESVPHIEHEKGTRVFSL